MTDETQGMPPLPETGGYRDVDGDWVQRGHTDAAMITYGRKCIDECIKALVDGDCFVAEMQGMNKAVRTIQWRFGVVDVDRAEQ